MDNFVNIVLSPIAPLTTSVNLSVPRDTPLSSLSQHITTRLPFPNLPASTLLIRHHGYLLPSTSSSTVTSLQNAPSDPIFLHLSIRLLGGKGGFGSQLRAQGGRMASRRKRGPQDKSSCRDLSGRRLKAVQDAKDLAEYIAKQPALEKKARDERRKKLEAVISQNPMQGIKMDDHAYWEDKERLVDGVKNAVREAVQSVRSEGGGKVEVMHTVSVKGGNVRREIKFSGFDEYDDSSEDDEDDEEQEEDEGEEGQDVEDEEEDEYEGSTEEETPVEGKGKEVAK